MRNTQLVGIPQDTLICFLENRGLLEGRAGACVEDDESASEIKHPRRNSHDAVGRRRGVLLGDRDRIVVDRSSHPPVRSVERSSSTG